MEEIKSTVAEEKEAIFSQKKWFWVGIIIALVNPIFAGLLVAAVYLTEPKLKRAGVVVAAISILWGAVLFYLVRQNFPVFPLGS